jgi:hypothetical protein
MITVVTEPRGQLTTVGGHLVTVPMEVVYTVEVVIGISVPVVVGSTRVVGGVVLVRVEVGAVMELFP